MKYWQTNIGHNRVTTREFGDIPNISKPFDVFVPVTLEEMQKHTAIRAETFCKLLDTCSATEFKNHPFHRGDVVLSVLHNPSARVRNAWDWDFQG